MVGIMIALIIGQAGGFGGYSAGIYRVNTSAVNKKLEAMAAPLVKTVFVQGGSGYSLVNNFMIGGYGLGGSKEVSKDSLKIKYGIGGGYFEVGYAKEVLKGVFPFAMLGIGGFGEEVLISATMDDVSWDSVWVNPYREVRISRGSFSVAPSAGIIIFPRNSFVGLMIKGSYNTIFTGSWEVGDGVKLADSPSSPYGFFTVNASLIFGGIVYGKKN